MQKANLPFENGQGAIELGNAPPYPRAGGGPVRKKKAVSIIVHEAGSHSFLRDYLDESSWLKLAHWCQLGEGSLRTIAHSPSDGVLVEMSVPGRREVECVRLLKQMKPALTVVMLAGHPDLFDCIRCFQAGADGYFVLPGTLELFEETIHSALNGWKPIPRELNKLLIERLICGMFFNGPVRVLTKCEREVLIYFALGYLDKEIADRTGKKSGTIHSLTNGIFKKLNVHKRYDAVKLCFGFDGGLIPESLHKDGPRSTHGAVAVNSGVPLTS